MKVFPTMFFFPCRIRFIHFIFKWLRSLNMFFQIFHYYTTQFLDFKKSNLVKWIVSCPLYSLLNVAFIAVFRKYLENTVKYGLQPELSMIYRLMCEIFFYLWHLQWRGQGVDGLLRNQFHFHEIFSFSDTFLSSENGAK